MSTQNIRIQRRKRRAAFQSWLAKVNLSYTAIVFAINKDANSPVLSYSAVTKWGEMGVRPNPKMRHTIREVFPGCPLGDEDEAYLKEEVSR